MSTVTDVSGGSGDGVDRGRWLACHRAEMDRGEARWLAELAEFDRAEEWALDGQFSCVHWLMWRGRLARQTAADRVRVARVLGDRPLVADAFHAGRLSYSAVRAITRAEDPAPEVDQALIALAEAGTVADVEAAVRSYQLHADQDRPPTDPSLRRHLSTRPAFQGVAEGRFALTEIEMDELVTILGAFEDRLWREEHAGAPGVSSPEDAGGSATGSATGSAAGTGEPSSAEDDELEPAGYRMAEQHPTGPARMADALMAVARTALAHLHDDGAAPAGDRFVVHYVRTADGATTRADGSPVEPGQAAQVACDASVVEHRFSEEGEPLAQGRRRRVWSTAQRRAAMLRDGDRCRFPGCTMATVDLHHLRPWSAGGRTDLDNALSACPRHHTLLHSGFTAAGNPNAELVFRRPDGTVIGTSRPRRPGPAVPLPLRAA